MNKIFSSRILKSLMPVLALIIVGLAVYSAAAMGGFVWDDGKLVRYNTLIRSFSHIGNMFTNNLGAGFDPDLPAGFPGTDYGYYRPLTFLSFALDYRIWEANPFGYHLANIILHILVCIALYTLTDILFKRPGSFGKLRTRPEPGKRVEGFAFWTAMLFLVHPVHTEMVSYISCRGDSLSTLFMLPAFIAYLRFLDTGGIRYFIFLSAGYTAALFSKENALVFPLLLMAYHIAFKRKLRLIPFIPLVAIIAGYILLRSTLTGFPPTDIYTCAVRIPGFFAAIAGYLKLLLLPVNLHSVYGNEPFSVYDPNVLLGAVLTAGLLLYAFRKRKDTMIIFSILWFFIALLPSSSVYPVNYAYMNEHWLYLPSMGFFMLAADRAVKAYRFTAVRAGMILLTAVFACMTYRQSLYWHDQVSLFERNLIFAPDTWWVYNNLGAGYAEKGEHKQAIQNYSQALKLDPRADRVYVNLAMEYAKAGRAREGVETLKRGMAINPAKSDQYYHAFGLVYDYMGARDKAIAAYQQALKINPRHRNARRYLVTPAPS